jgi:putative ABC transport system permease protein
MSGLALLAEVIAGLAQRPGRAALTGLGTLLGVGAFVAVVGITGSANSQIGDSFNQRAATRVSVSYVGQGDTASAFAVDAERRVDTVRGVRSSGIRVDWLPGGRVARYLGREDLPSVKVDVVGVSAGFLGSVRSMLTAGRTLDPYVVSTRSAVIGSTVAAHLGIRGPELPAYVYIDDVQFLVVGIIGASQGEGASAGSVYVPVGAASSAFGPPDSTAAPTMVVSVDLGAASVVARQLPFALDADHPSAYRPDAVSDPTIVRDRVSAELQQLFLVLAGVSLVIGAVGIANTTLVSVLDRFAEIGLRRALGALPRHVMAQILVEACLLGTVGGLVGSSLGVASTLAVAATHHWTAVLPGWLIAVAPATGALTGLIAGLYPSIRAARVEPVDALRRG